MEEVLRTWEVDSHLTDEPASDSMVGGCFLFWDVTSSEFT